LILNAGWLKEYDPEGVLDLFLDERQKQKHFQNMTKEIDEFLNFFDNKNKTETIVAAKRAKLQDQDGWVTIDSRVGRRMGPEDFAMRLATRIDMDKVRETEKKRQLQGFYRFQVRERKKDRVEELRKDFENDKRIIKKMEESKKFRPY